MTDQLTHIISNAPQVYQDMYVEHYTSPERLDYHPEGTLGAHINITFNRALITQSFTMKMIALLHDICKGLDPVKSKGGLRTITMANGEKCTYHSNPDHPYQAVKFIEDNEEIQQWIIDQGADLEMVKTVVGNHMKHKSYLQGLKGVKGGMKASKRTLYEEKMGARAMTYLDEFAKIDNMLIEYKFEL